jgi:nucleoside-diphosphate-sugar epimerase
MLDLDAPLPDVIADEAELDELLSRPTAGVVETFRNIPGDILFLGVGGKMGPTMARMAVRAAEAAGGRRRILGASRFSDAAMERQLRDVGVETIRCDLLDPKQVDALPDAPNVVAMSALKFGSTGKQALTWGMNTYVPTLVARRFAESRIVAFSTGNVYPLTDVRLGGCRETDPTGPVGEYAMSCLGRERMYEYFAEANGTPTSIVRLNYACELRYGVLADMARRVLQGETIDLSMGCVNAIWQGDANAMTLQSFGAAASPAFTFNLAGPEILSVRRLCEEYGRRFGKEPQFVGAEANNALLSNGQMAHDRFGYPRVPIRRVIDWVAEWTLRGGRTLGKPTHFETRDGKY